DENYVEAQSLFSLISVQEIHTLVVTLNETYQKIEQYAQAYNRIVQVKPQLETISIKKIKHLLEAYQSERTIQITTQLEQINNSLETINKANFDRIILFNKTQLQSKLEQLNQSIRSYQGDILVAIAQDALTYNITANTSLNNACQIFTGNVSAKLFTFCFNQTNQNLPNTKFALTVNITLVNQTPKQVIQLKEPTRVCCSNGKCTTCQETKAPILFIHGHAFDKSTSPLASLASFAQIQHALEKDGFSNGGRIDPSLVYHLPKGSFEQGPVTFRGSFYYITNIELGDYTVFVQKSERIENYALRLKELVDSVKYLTNSSDVIIVAHSMGGLVAREYIALFGDESVNKLITINTPHQGIIGRSASICDTLGATKECEDMTTGSTFLQRLQRTQTTNKLTVIRSSGCEMGDVYGDGVVTEENSYVPNVNNILIQGTCTDALQTNLHTQLLDIKLYPTLYNQLVDLVR
ncbi:MAG: putative alpha/beta hydrolase family protein, partial [Candidatus Woesearchaeota archaeon]